MLPSPVLYSDPEAHPPEKTIPNPKIRPAMTLWMPYGAAWYALFPVAVTKEAVKLKRMVAIMMPTNILGTPTANRSRKAEEKQNLPYWRHIP
jgi:hypothetical protein